VKDAAADDRVLVARVIANGDERAYAELYDRHTPFLYGYALRLTNGDDTVAQDIVHDAWIGAVERFAAFEWRSSLRTWIGGFVANAARRSVASSSKDDPLDETVGQLDAPETIDLERALADLPDGYRQVLLLHDYEGYTHEEIATLLGIEPGTSKSQLSRARSAMRRVLSDPQQPQ
jgi:RNA polymerase sigma-70 factor (ECF subfamily)